MEITLILLLSEIIDTRIEKRKMMLDGMNFEKTKKNKARNERKNETAKIKKEMLNI